MKVSQDKKFFHLHYETPMNTGLQEILKPLMAWKHNPLVTDYYPNEESKSKMKKPEKLRIQLPGKQSKIFKFNKRMIQKPKQNEEFLNKQVIEKEVCWEKD